MRIFTLLLLLITCIPCLSQTLRLNFRDGYLPAGDIAGCGSGSICTFGPQFITFQNIDKTGPKTDFAATNGCVTVQPIYGMIFIGRNQRGGAWRRGDAIVIAYNFKAGVSYTILTQTVHYDDLHADLNSKKFPSLQVRVTNTTTLGNVCTVSAEPQDIYSATDPYAEFFANATVPNGLSYNSFTFTATECFPYLWLSSKPHAEESDGSLNLREITIQENLSPATLTGPASMCAGTNTATYSITNAPPGTSYTWSLSNANASFITPPNQNSVTIQKIASSGNTELTAILQTCGKTFERRIVIPLGIPNTPFIRDYTADPYADHIKVFATPIIEASSYNWYIDGYLQKTTSVPYWTHPKPVGNCGQGYEVSVDASNVCGASSQGYEFIIVRCQSAITLSPNPASNTVTISMEQPKNNGAASAKSLSVSKDGAITSVRIFDPSMKLKLQQHFTAGAQKVSLNVSTLQPGVYFVEISSGTYKTTKKLLLQR